MKIINKNHLVILVSMLLSFLMITCTENHLLPKFGTITITSDPVGAEVFLNNESKGTTPLTIKELISGAYTIDLVRNEFSDTTISIDINENQNAEFDVYLLEENPQGRIALTSKPSGADIFINDQNTNQQTPYTLSNLERGNYDIALKLNLYDDAIFSIELDKDESVSKETRLAIAGTSGGLIINSTPSGAMVFIDNFNTGVTPDTLSPVAPGNYAIQLTLDNFKDTSFIATIAAGVIQTLDIELKGLFVIEAIADPSEGGTITGAGGYTEGENVQLIATPNEGYDFVNWKEGSSVISSNSTIEFVTTGNRSLTANFDLKEYQIEAITNPSSAGTVSGAGSFKHGESVELSFANNDGYEFINWTENDIQVSTNEVYSFTATGNRSLVANFKELGNLTINSDPEGAAIYLNGTNTGQVTPYEFINLDVGAYTVELKLDHFADVLRDVNITTNNTTDLGTITLVDITPDVTMDISFNVNDNGQLAFYFQFNQAIVTSTMTVSLPPSDGRVFNPTFIYSAPEGARLNWNFSRKIDGIWKFVITGTKQDGRKLEFDITKNVTVN